MPGADGRARPAHQSLCACRGRAVQRLERAGVITGYRAEVDPKAIGFPIAAVVRIRPTTRQLQKIPELAREMPVVDYRITGEDCFFVAAPPLDGRSRGDPRPLHRPRADDDVDRAPTPVAGRPLPLEP